MPDWDQENLNQSKITIPRLPETLYRRRRLVDSLYDSLDYRLYFVVAPAGYGKTTAVLDWVDQTREADLDVAWLSLDELDTHPQRFLRYFIAGLHRVFPAFGAESMDALHAMQSRLDIPRLLRTILRDADEHIDAPFVYVLDDCHLLYEQTMIFQFLSDLARDMGDAWHLVLLSRVLLGLPALAQLVTQNQTGGMGYEDLAFTVEELQDFMLQNYGQSLRLEQAKAMISQTEGWITGVMLTAQTPGEGLLSVATQHLPQNTSLDIYDYLAQRVLERQPEQVQDFLLRSALLGEFDAALLGDIFGDDNDWAVLISEVQKRNLFVMAVDNRPSGLWVRYHHLFRDFLQARLADRHPDVYADTVRRFAEFSASQRDWDRAFALYMRLNDQDVLLSFIEDSVEAVLYDGGILRVRAWLQAVPEEDLRAYPRLMARYGYALAGSGFVEDGLIWLELAIERLGQLGDLEHLAGTLIWRATVFRVKGDYPSSLADVDSAMKLLDDDDYGRPDFRAEALRLKGLIEAWTGHTDAGIAHLKEAHRLLLRLGKSENLAVVKLDLGLQYLNRGQYSVARTYFEPVLAFWEAWHNALQHALVCNNLGVLNHGQGRYLEAVQFLSTARELAARDGYLTTLALSLASLGDVYAEIGLYDAATRVYRESRSLCEQNQSRFLLFYLEQAAAHVARRSGLLTQARHELDLAAGRLTVNSPDYEHGLWHFETALLHYAEGLWDDALAHAAQAVKRFDADQRDLDTVKALCVRAALLQRTGDRDAAEADLERAFSLAARIDSDTLLIVALAEVRRELDTQGFSYGIQQRLQQLWVSMDAWAQQLPALHRQLRKASDASIRSVRTVSIKALGDSGVWIGEKLVTSAEWQARVAQDVLFCLIAHPNGITREEIAAVFWPEKSPGAIRTHLKKTMWRIRHALDDQPVIEFEDNHYRFNFHCDYRYDVEEFETLCDAADRSDDVYQRVHFADEALALYQGHYLPELDASWVPAQREYLWQRYLRIALQACDDKLSLGHAEDTLNTATAILALDVTGEPAYRMLMRAYAVQGDRAAVARTYQTCVRVLQEELDVAPAPQTLELFRRLTQSDR